jgi:hypothetical protein
MAACEPAVGPVPPVDPTLPPLPTLPPAATRPTLPTSASSASCRSTAAPLPPLRAAAAAAAAAGTGSARASVPVGGAVEPNSYAPMSYPAPPVSAAPSTSVVGRRHPPQAGDSLVDGDRRGQRRQAEVAAGRVDEQRRGVAGVDSCAEARRARVRRHDVVVVHQPGDRLHLERGGLADEDVVEDDVVVRARRHLDRRARAGRVVDGVVDDQVVVRRLGAVALEQGDARLRALKMTLLRATPRMAPSRLKPAEPLQFAHRVPLDPPVRDQAVAARAEVGVDLDAVGAGVGDVVAQDRGLSAAFET